jgi:hypothetical protein
MDPTQVPKVAATATADVIRAFKATDRHTFLGHLDNGISDWKADDIKATIIAEKFERKLRDVAFEKNEWVRKGKAEHEGKSVEDVAADKDQHEQWNLRTEQAGEGLRSARSWRACKQQFLEEVAHVKVCWDNMWYLYELGLDETSEILKETSMGLLMRYSALLKIQRNAAASESRLCAAMGVGSMLKLKVIDNGKRIEEDEGDEPTRKPDFVWELYRTHH